MSHLRSLIVFACVFISSTYAYVDFGALTLPVEPLYEPTPRPNQLPEHFDLRYEILPSMITAVAPSVTLAMNGTRQTEYSLHFHHYFSRTRQGRGVFDKRGVFSGDPPVASCTPCGGNVTYTPPSFTTTSTASCTTHTYHGVFDYPQVTSSSAACFNSNYSGVFEPSTSSYTGLPCCFTIPASCRLNSTSYANSTTSFAASTGVFRPTSTSTTTRSSLTSTSSRFSLSTPSSTSQAQSAGPILASGSTLFSSSLTSSSSSSATTKTTTTIISGTTTVLTLTSSSSAASSNPYSSALSSMTVSTTIYSILVISSTTITLTPSRSASSTSSSGPATDLPTLTVITGSSATTGSASLVITTIKSNTIIGCGEASGSGVIDGTGTVYIAGTSVTVTGTASGYASSLSGCGTIIATTGSFSGIASITGCGFGYGTGTLTGSGTVWPRIAGGLLSFVSSGTIAGVGSFRGCGTMTGTGTFSATVGSTITWTGTPGPTKTVSVYLSYCPDPTANAVNGLLNLGSDMNSNSTQSPSFANQTLNGTNASANNNTITPSPKLNDTNPVCQICPESVGVCCPPTVSCNDSDGKCPLYALENSGNTINGYLIQQVTNSSAPVAGRKKVRALPKGSVQGIGMDLAEVARDIHRHREKRKAHHKHY